MKPRVPQEYRITALRECPVPEDLHLCDTPQKAVEYWRLHVATGPYYNPECECLAVLLLTTRRRVKGHQVLTFGTKDTLLVDPGTVFRGAVVASAAAVVLMHNHPSGVIPHPVLCRMACDLPQFCWVRRQPDAA
jgi:DNA repair protein RadC